MLTVGSLFSGAGLLDAGLHQAGIEHAWFVEREPDRRELLARRWPDRPVHDDVRTVGVHNLERVDGIVGGFPCKGVSGAGLGTGLAHPETALWAEFARIVGEVQPAYVLVENVARILTLHGGNILRVVVGDLAALGFDVAWDCVRASDVGAPHGRDRWFAVARHPNGTGWAQRRQPEYPRQERQRDLAHEIPLAAAPDADTSRRRAGSERTAPRAGGSGGLDGPAVDRSVADAPDAAGAGLEGAGLRGLPAERGGEAPADAPSGPARRNGENTARGLAAEPDGVCGVAVEWGGYGPAIRRWEAIHGPAPAPLTRLRGLDDGDAKLRRLRARMDRQRLSALGDGVHVAVARLFGEALMELARADREARDAV